MTVYYTEPLSFLMGRKCFLVHVPHHVHIWCVNLKISIKMCWKSQKNHFRIRTISWKIHVKVIFTHVSVLCTVTSWFSNLEKSLFPLLSCTASESFMPWHMFFPNFINFHTSNVFPLYMYVYVYIVMQILQEFLYSDWSKKSTTLRIT